MPVLPLGEYCETICLMGRPISNPTETICIYVCCVLYPVHSLWADTQPQRHWWPGLTFALADTICRGWWWGVDIIYYQYVFNPLHTEGPKTSEPIC